MKIAIIGASGKQGSCLLKEALDRGHDVTAIVRDAKKITTQNVKIIEKDILDLTYDDVKDNDVLIDAFGTWDPEKMNMHQTTLKHLSDILADTPIRLLVVGGAGSLYTDASHQMKVMDTPDFPEGWKPVASNMGAAYDALKARDDVRWTYLSPSANFVADGKRTGKYHLGGDELLVNDEGESIVSYADYAIAMIDEAEQNKHPKERFTVVS